MAESLVVQSKVREYLKKSGDIRLSKDAIDSLNSVVESSLKKAIDRAKGNDRKTVRAVDF